MFKKKLHPHIHDHEDVDETPTQLLTADHFRLEAEEHAARAERARIEHRASELGVTVAQLQAGIPQVVEEVPIGDAHVRESLRESDKAAHEKHD